jgi:YHS domain-containing protein
VETAMTTEMAKEIAGIEQTTCPVMEGNPIKKEIFTEYQGKKVYFCCPPCETKFRADPEKYLAKLPQFKEQ